MAERAFSVSLQLRPRILPLSSIRKTVSNCVRNAYRESFTSLIELCVVDLATGLYAGGGSGFAEPPPVVVGFGEEKGFWPNALSDPCFGF